MADAYYNDAPNAMLGNPVHSVVNFDTDDIRIVGLDEGSDALNLADEDLANITAGARVFVSSNLSSKTVGVVGDGIWDWANKTISSVSGSSVESLTVYKHTGTDSTSPLILNLDSWTSLPLTPNGGDVILAPAAGGVLDIS